MINKKLKNQGYRAVIPDYILWDLDLNANHLRIYGLIEQMESNPNPDVQPTFSNKYLATQLGITIRQVQYLTELLKTKKYIKRSQLPNGHYYWSTCKQPAIETEQIDDDLDEQGGGVELTSSIKKEFKS